MTTLTREKIEALREAARVANSDTDYIPPVMMRCDPDTILSLCDMAEAGAVRVKPLEWRKSNVAERWVASNPWGGECEIVLNKRGVEYWSPQLGGLRVSWPTLEAAKAAAQADYETRILSTLEVGQTDRVGEAIVTMAAADESEATGEPLDEKAVQAALRAADDIYQRHAEGGAFDAAVTAAIHAYLSHLAPAPAQAEPVAWRCWSPLQNRWIAVSEKPDNPTETYEPLYASPPSPAEVEISDEMVEKAAAILPRVWPGGFEDQSVDPLEFRPNERARQVARAALRAALSAGGRP